MPLFGHAGAMTSFELIEHDEQATAAVRGRITMDQIPDFIDTGLRAVMEAVQRQGAHPAGPPYSLYRGMPTDTIDVEVGFPVTEPVEPAGDVVPSSLPAGRAAEGLHVGKYDTLRQTYDEMARWITDQGLRPADHMWETYLSEPTGDPATWQTKVTWPVSRAR